MFTVQVGRAHSAYSTKLVTSKLHHAMIHYNGYLVHSGGRKRLLEDGKVIEREIT